MSKFLSASYNLGQYWVKLYILSIQFLQRFFSNNINYIIVKVCILEKKQ